MATRTHYLSALVVSTAFIAVLTVISSVHVSAEAATPPAKAGLQVSPVIIELKVDRGKTYTFTSKVTNVTVNDQEYSASVSDFTSKDETGDPRLFDDMLPSSASVKSWVSSIPTFSLQPQQSKSFTVQVSVPTDAEPGGHYGAIVFTSNNTDGSTASGVAQTASVGELMLLTVSGNIAEQASVASFYASNSNTDKQSGFFEKAPISLVARIKNEGNVHVKPTGQILVHDMFGGTTATIAVNAGSTANVLPDSVRRFDTTLNNPWLFGYYTADLQLGYGSHGQALTSTVGFWVIPYKIVLVVLLLITTALYILVRVLKVYNRRIISRAIQKNEKKSSNHSKK